MATVDFYLKKGDTGKPISLQLRGADGSIPDLTGATVVWNMRRVGYTTPKMSRVAMTVIDIPTAEVKLNWQASHVDTDAKFQAEVEVTYSNGQVQTFPNDRYIIVQILPDIA